MLFNKHISVVVKNIKEKEDKPLKLTPQLINNCTTKIIILVTKYSAYEILKCLSFNSSVNLKTKRQFDIPTYE